MTGLATVIEATASSAAVCQAQPRPWRMRQQRMLGEMRWAGGVDGLGGSGMGVEAGSGGCGGFWAPVM
jgi:hypothetical protein